MTPKNKIEVCYSPALFPCHKNDEAVVVVIDILRATTSIVTAFINGVNKIIPVGTLEEAKALKEKGFPVAAERDGIVRDFADFGNSPYNFTPEWVKDNDIVYSTTNGTNTIMMAKDAYRVLIGSYLNISALKEFVLNEDRDVLLFCAGWKSRFNLEDTLFAGALAELILESSNYHTICDSTLGAIDLWNVARNDLMGYIDKVAQRTRLKKNGLDDVLDYCHTFDTTKVIPVLKENYLIDIKDF